VGGDPGEQAERRVWKIAICGRSPGLAHISCPVWALWTVMKVLVFTSTPIAGQEAPPIGSAARTAARVYIGRCVIDDDHSAQPAVTSGPRGGS
jgi:hypothetical protein